MRSVISLPAGVGQMPIAKFLFWSLLGTLAWSALLLGVGFLLQEQFRQAHGVVEWVTRAVLAFLVGAYLWRVLRSGGKDGRRQAVARQQS